MEQILTIFSKESKEGIIRFPHEDYEVVNLWLGRYYGVDFLAPDETDVVDPTTMLNLGKLYYLADR